MNDKLDRDALIAKLNDVERHLLGKVAERTGLDYSSVLTTIGSPCDLDYMPKDLRDLWGQLSLESRAIAWLLHDDLSSYIESLWE